MRFNPIEGQMEQNSDRPTYWFRFYERYVGPITTYQHPSMRAKERILQQLWDRGDGTQEWRDVPLVVESDSFPTPD
jgi:hypothetical protein